MDNLIKDIANWEKDFLTNCYPRVYLMPFLEKLEMEFLAEKKPFSIMIVDLDHFKTLNDTYGHAFGDDALKYFSSSMRLTLETDYMDSIVKRFIFRYGGDEFVIVFPSTDSHQTYAMANTLLRNIKNRPFLFQGVGFKMSFSGGIATYPYDGKVEDLVNKADKALYFSKKHGKAKVTQHSKIKTEESKYFIKSLLKLAFIVAIIAGFIVAINKSFQKGIAKGISIVFGRKHKIPTLPLGVKEIDIEKAKVQRIKPENMVTVYLKTGTQLRGVIVREGDPLELKMVFDKGEGTIALSKSEISTIVPDQ